MARQLARATTDIGDRFYCCDEVPAGLLFLSAQHECKKIRQYWRFGCLADLIVIV